MRYNVIKMFEATLLTFKNLFFAFFLMCCFLFSSITKAQTTYTESAVTYGLDIPGAKDGGHAWADYDRDGDVDVLINVSGSTKSYLMRNNGNNTFTNVQAALIPGMLDDPAERQAAWGDVNNDGRPDFMINSHGVPPPSATVVDAAIQIYIQNTDGTFGDGAGGTAPITVGAFGHTVNINPMNSEGLGFFDFEGDGDLDIFFDNQGSGIELLQNNYIDHTTHSTVDPPAASLFTHITTGDGPGVVNFGLAQFATDGDFSTAADVNDDGWVDLFMRKRDENDFFLNQGEFFTNGSDLAQAENSNKGGNGLWDLDNDGDMDAVWTENGFTQIFRNDGPGVWTALGVGVFPGLPQPPNAETGTSSAAIEALAAGDIDNDGDIDIIFVGDSRSYLFINQLNSPTPAPGVVGSGSAMTFSLDSEQFHAGADGEGTTMLDIDDDGDLDIYMNINGGPNQLYINNLAAANRDNHLLIDVTEDRGADGSTGSFSGRTAMGANVLIRDCTGNVISGLRQVNGVFGHGTQQAEEVHFGLPLGENEKYVIEVHYPNFVDPTGSVTRLYASAVAEPSTIPGTNHFRLTTTTAETLQNENAPIANDDLRFAPDENTVSVQINVFDNDSEPDGEDFFILSVVQPAIGSVVIDNADTGLITYTYSAGTPFPGTSFDYTISDAHDVVCPGTGRFDTALVTLASCNPSGPDTDGDGVSDSCDLDDDNDGILDTDEGTLDIDNDGIIASLDLNSDGDGCFDAVEGDGGFTFSDTDASGALTGGVDANGVPLSANGGQGKGSSANITMTAEICDDDGDGVINANDICPYSDDNIDTDGDLVPDGCDIDNDNDAIIDYIESAERFQSSITWTFNDNSSLEPFTGFDPRIDEWAVDAAGPLVFNNDKFSTNGSEVAFSNIVSADFSESIANGDFMEISLTTGVETASFTLRDIQSSVTFVPRGDSYYSATLYSEAGTGVWTTLSSDVFHTYSGSGNFDTFKHFEGDIPMDANTEYKIRFYVYNQIDDSPEDISIFDDLALTFNAGRILDTDGDGIDNRYDLDSDGDGIPDNVEGQRTTSYITPNGKVGPDGFETAFSRTITPTNTDGTDNPDYLDLDSDNEGGNDTVEAGITLSGTDTDNDGLDDATDATADYTDAGGTIDDPLSAPLQLPDVDGDAATGGDVDFRDATIDLIINLSASSVTEGGDIIYTATLSRIDSTGTYPTTNNSGFPITVDFADLNTGSATSGSDYTAIPAGTTITIADGSSTGTYSLATTDDTLFESDETVIAQISNPSTGTIGTSDATGTIVDNDGAVTIALSADSVTEGGDITFTATLSTVNNTGSPITVDLADLLTGTATSGSDFTAIPAGTAITIADGASMGTYSVATIDDTIFESNETVIARISNPSNANIGTSDATGTIVDNDGAVTIALSADSVTEGGDITFTATLSTVNNTGSPITVDLTDLGTGTATSGDDLSAIPAARK